MEAVTRWVTTPESDSCCLVGRDATELNGSSCLVGHDPKGVVMGFPLPGTADEVK